MVKTSVIIAIIFNILVSFGVPILGLLYLKIKKKAHVIKPFLTGAIVFTIFQMLIRIPLLQNVLSNMQWFIELSMNPWLYGLFLGVTAGIAEEVGRYLGFKTILRDRLSFDDGIAYGLGHGGIEAIIILGVTNINNLILAISINNGTYEALMNKSNGMITDGLKQQFINMSVNNMAMGGIERIFAIILQIAMTLIVLYAVREKKFKYILYAILIHTVIDAPVVILPQVFGFTTVSMEAVIAVMAAIAVVWIRKFKSIIKDNKIKI